MGVGRVCRARVQPLLESLCKGLSRAELPAALAGLLAEAPHVRGAAIAALSDVPFLPDGVQSTACSPWAEDFECRLTKLHSRTIMLVDSQDLKVDLVTQILVSR